MDNGHRFLMQDVKSDTAVQERIYVIVPVAIKLPANSTDDEQYLNEESLTGRKVLDLGSI